MEKRKLVPLQLTAICLLVFYFLGASPAYAASQKIERQLQDITKKIKKEEKAIAILKGKCGSISEEKREVINYLKQEKPVLAQDTPPAVKEPYSGKQIEEKLTQQQLGQEYIAQKKMLIKQEVLKAQFENRRESLKPRPKPLKQKEEKPKKIRPAKPAKRIDPEKQDRIKRHREEKKKMLQEEAQRKRLEKIEESAQKKEKPAAKPKNKRQEKNLTKSKNKPREETIEYIDPQIEEDTSGEDLYYEPPGEKNLDKESNTYVDKLKEVDEYLRKNLW